MTRGLRKIAEDIVKAEVQTVALEKLHEARKVLKRRRKAISRQLQLFPALPEPSSDVIDAEVIDRRD